MLIEIAAPRVKTSVFALVATFILVYLLPLGVRPLKRPDEVRYAAVPQEMLARGDMVVPYLNGVRYFEKPVFSYWMTAASLRVFGKNEFAAPSAGCAVVGCCRRGGCVVRCVRLSRCWRRW